MNHTLCVAIITVSGQAAGTVPVISRVLRTAEDSFHGPAMTLTRACPCPTVMLHLSSSLHERMFEFDPSHRSITVVVASPEKGGEPHCKYVIQ